jgi:hypothetical protein
MSPSRPTSAATGSAPIAAACRSHAAWSRSDNTTCAPTPAKRVHRANPMPLAPPVTTHTLSLTSMASSSQVAMCPLGGCRGVDPVRGQVVVQVLFAHQR